MVARFKIDQTSSAGAGVPNRSRWDLNATEDIIFNVVGPVVGATYAWDLVDRAGNPLADGTLSSATGLTTQIAAVKVQDPCAYVVRLTETLPSGATSEHVLVAVALGVYPSPNLDPGLTQAEAYYMILVLAGAGGGGGPGVTDHGALTGLGDDDHTQYLRADGSRTLTGNQAVASGITIDGRDISADGATLDGHTGSIAGVAADLATHEADTGNPHATTAAQVGAPPTSRAINTTAPLTGGGDLSVDRTLGINPATTSDPGSMSAADKVKLDGLDPKLKTIKQGFSTAKATDEPTLVASLYFKDGTLQVPARAFLGTDTGANQATLNLIRADDPTIIASWIATGVLQDISSVAPVALLEGWHQLTLQCDSPNINAILSGIDWLYLED